MTLWHKLEKKGEKDVGEKKRTGRGLVDGGLRERMTRARLLARRTTWRAVTTAVTKRNGFPFPLLDTCAESS